MVKTDPSQPAVSTLYDITVPLQEKGLEEGVVWANGVTMNIIMRTAPRLGRRKGFILSR